MRVWGIRGVARVGLCVATAVLGLPAGASAATITVDTFDDVELPASSDGDCSLREAVQTANTNSVVDDCVQGEASPNIDTIHLDPGTYLLDNTLIPDDANGSGDSTFRPPREPEAPW